MNQSPTYISMIYTISRMSVLPSKKITFGRIDFFRDEATYHSNVYFDVKLFNL